MEEPFQEKYYVGKRLSLRSQLCTVRYVGAVAGRPGQHLGVEWDDPTRGKHDGSHDGVSYFKCRSRSRTAASFLKSTQQWDSPQSFLEALREKYMSDPISGRAQTVYFSGKEAEKVGFDKFGERQRQLHGIHILVLDGMRIQHRPSDDNPDSISQICAEIQEIDLSHNLFESLNEIVSLVHLLPKLHTITLDGNRFQVNRQEQQVLPKVHTLSLRHTLLDDNEVSITTGFLPSLTNLILSNNEFQNPLMLDIPSSILSLDLTGNDISSLADIRTTDQHNKLQNLILKRNNISTVGAPTSLFNSITNLDLSYNAVSDWEFISEIYASFPSLRHIRVTGNPLYAKLTSADGRPLAAEDGYMLTLARLPTIRTLNYSTITEKERLNAEVYYLGQIATELSAASSDEQMRRILARHPRYDALCEEYGRPSVRQAVQGEVNGADPNSLAARMVNVTFQLSPDTLSREVKHDWTVRVPRSFDVYSVLGLVAKRPGILQEGKTPLCLQLTLETDEEVPPEHESGHAGPEWWDSDDEGLEKDFSSRKEGWKKRAIELMPGTRTLATYIDGNHATITVGLRSRGG